VRFGKGSRRIAAGAAQPINPCLHCTDDSLAFIAVWHGLAIALCTLVGACAGRNAQRLAEGAGPVVHKASPIHSDSSIIQPWGLMFWFSRKMFSGSYLGLDPPQLGVLLATIADGQSVFGFGIGQVQIGPAK
jgi:Negative regulator of sigma F